MCAAAIPAACCTVLFRGQHRGVNMRGSHVTKWQSHRKISLGPVRRACPASGASWNVQVVRGKMTSKCLWHACQALAIGFLLMVIGAGMATIGYYAEHIADNRDIKDNLTVPVRSETRGINLHNLSYAGPIVMGFGGFIIVAACVMTFEARDSASKVVPARFKLNYGKHDSSARSSAERRPTGLSLSTTSQTHHDSKSSSLEMHSNEHSQHEQQQVALVHGCNSHTKNDGLRLNLNKTKSPSFRTMSASAIEHQHSHEQKHMHTQTSSADVEICHINERKSAKSAGGSTTSKRPSSLKLPESQAKIRSKHLYRSRTKPEESTSTASPSNKCDYTFAHIDGGHADEIFVISTETEIKSK